MSLFALGRRLLWWGLSRFLTGFGRRLRRGCGRGALAQHFKEGCGGVREGNVTAVCDPERSEVAQLRNGNRRERTALQLFGYAHTRDKREAYLELNETLDGFHCRQLKRDVQRCMVLLKGLYNLVTGGSFNVMRYK